MPTIEFTCYNDRTLKETRPILASKVQPEWWKGMKINEIVRGDKQQTIRACPAMQDWLTMGYYLIAEKDMYVQIGRDKYDEGGTTSSAWSFDDPKLGSSSHPDTKFGNAFEPEKRAGLPVKDAFKFRNVGPAFLSGRIADIAIHPDNENVWYVAVGSGGVWMTNNAGTTWNPIFDSQPTYSTGSITIDPSNPSIIWVGTGENVGGRHVAYGDGVYRSADGGKTWKNMGLKKTEHISEIIVHPDNSDVVYVAAQGPLWSSGGERGLYKLSLIHI